MTLYAGEGPTAVLPLERVLTAKDLSLLRCNGVLLKILRVIVLLTSRVKQSSNTS